MSDFVELHHRYDDSGRIGPANMLLVWDGPNLDMGLGALLGGRPSGAQRPRFDAVGRWLINEAAAIDPAIDPEATVFTNVSPDAAEAVRAQVHADADAGAVPVRHAGADAAGDAHPDDTGGDSDPPRHPGGHPPEHDGDAYGDAHVPGGPVPPAHHGSGTTRGEARRRPTPHLPRGPRALGGLELAVRHRAGSGVGVHEGRRRGDQPSDERGRRRHPHGHAAELGHRGSRVHRRLGVGPGREDREPLGFGEHDRPDVLRAELSEDPVR